MGRICRIARFETGIDAGRRAAILMHGVLVSIAVCLGLVHLAAGAQESAPSASSVRDLKSIIDARVLRVALTRFDLPSFHVRGSDGNLAGPEIEMAQQIGRALGVQVEFVDQAESFDAVVGLVASGRADIGISKLSQTYERLQRVQFSTPYVTLRHALLFDRAAIARTGAGRPPAEVLQKFHGRIGVIAGSAYVDFAHRNFPQANLVAIRTWDGAVESLLGGKVDALYRDEFEIRRVLNNNPTLNVRFGPAAIVDQYALLSIALCDSCSKLRAFIDYHIGYAKGAFTLNALLSSKLGRPTP